MRKVDYRGIGADIVTHLKLKVVEDSKPDTYNIGQDHSSDVGDDERVEVLVKFDNFVAKAEFSQTSDSKTRDVNFFIIFGSPALSDNAVDLDIDIALSDFECYLNYPEQGGPIYDNTLIEWAEASSGNKGRNPKTQGIYGWIVLTVRIMEI